jgi:hypothetical protein
VRSTGERDLEPFVVVGGIVVAEWICIAVFATVVRHNGWLFYQGGDETYSYTGAWTLAHGHLVKASVGYAWSYLLAPFALVAGPNLLSALPALVIVQVTVLVPTALACFYAIGARIAGRGAGYAVAAFAVAAPLLAVPLWDHSYHAKYVEQFLPQALGLTAMADFPSMVCILVAAALGLRALNTGRVADGVLTGVALGLAIGVKPANALFLAGIVPAFAVARRFRAAGAFAAGLAPALLTLALWKYRGLGYLPIFKPSSEAFAAGRAFVVADGAGRYLNLDWDQLRKNYVDFVELFRAARFWLLVPLVGVAAVARRSVPAAVLLGGWLAGFLLVKGSSGQASLDGGTLLRLLFPGLPPLVILTALAPLLFVGRMAVAEPPPSRTLGRVALGVVVALFAVLPFAVVAVSRAPAPRATVTYGEESVMVPIDGVFDVVARRTGDDMLVTWRAREPAGMNVFYRVFRSRPVTPASDPALHPGHDGVRCFAQPFRNGTSGRTQCWLEMPSVGVTRLTRFVERAGPGPWVYRVGLAANWIDDVNGGDVFLVSTPARSAQQP